MFFFALISKLIGTINQFPIKTCYKRQRSNY